MFLCYSTENASNAPHTGEMFDPLMGQQTYYAPVQPYVPNPGDPYSMPVYIMPQATQQVFIPATPYGPTVDMSVPPPFYGADRYVDQPPPGDYHDYHERCKIFVVCKVDI